MIEIGAADHASIRAVAPLPDIVRQEHHRFGPGTVVVRTEVTSERRRRAEEAEEVERDGGAPITLRLRSAVHNGQAAPLEGRQP